MNNAKWIYTRNPESFESGTAENVNPWESRITVEMQKSPLEPESGLSIFRKKFTVTNDITDCEITATSLGNFDLYCNGKRVGSTENGKTVYDEMKPGWSDFDKRALSYTYSLKDYLVKGENSILAVVSNGWWAGRIAVWTYKATDTAFIAKLTFDNGTTIETDESWESYFGGRIRYADIWDGEYYDSTYESFEKMSISDTVIENPSKTLIFTSFQGVITPHFGPTIRVREHLSRVPETVTLYEGSIENDSDFGKINIIPTSYKFKEKQTILFDYGQNMVGIPYIKIRGKKGTRVDIIFGEMLNDSGKKSRGNDGPEGSIYSANYRSAKAKCTYIMNGDEDFEEFRPLLTFYGFRYMEISIITIVSALVLVKKH